MSDDPARARNALLKLARAGAADVKGRRKVLQSGNDKQCFVTLRIRSATAEMEASPLVDTGCSKDLIFPKRKAEDLGLKPDGEATLAEAAGGNWVLLCRYGSVRAALCVEDPESRHITYVNDEYLSVWVYDEPRTAVINPEVFQDSNFIIQDNIKQLSPIKSGKDSKGQDALLGRPGMRKLQLGMDPAGDMVYKLSGPDAVM